MIAEHRLYYLTELADRIVYLEKGEIKGIYTSEEFRQLSDMSVNTWAAAVGSTGGIPAKSPLACAYPCIGAAECDAPLQEANNFA